MFAGFALFAAELKFFKGVGFVVYFTIFGSLVYTFFFFSSLVLTFGPSGNFGFLPGYRPNNDWLEG